MQQISPPAGNGDIDTILVQAEGDTGDHTDRKSDFNQSMAESGNVEPNRARRSTRPPSMTAMRGGTSEPCKGTAIPSRPTPTWP